MTAPPPPVGRARPTRAGERDNALLIATAAHLTAGHGRRSELLSFRSRMTKISRACDRRGVVLQPTIEHYGRSATETKTSHVTSRLSTCRV